MDADRSRHGFGYQTPPPPLKSQKTDHCTVSKGTTTWVRSQPDPSRAIASLISQRINRETEGETHSVLHLPTIPQGLQSDVERRKEKRQAIEANGKRILVIKAKRKSDKSALPKVELSPAAIANNIFMQIGHRPKWEFERNGSTHVCTLIVNGRQWEGKGPTKKRAKQDVCRAFLEDHNGGVA